jgi:Ulp1 protease family, C-terminal catalytic domain
MSVKFPPHIQQYLPRKTLTVQEFLVLNLPVPEGDSVATLQQIQLQKFFSNEEPTTQDVDIIVTLPTPPDNIVKSLQQCMRRKHIVSIHCPHAENTGGQRFPVWVISFWSELAYCRSIQEKWKSAVANLQAQIARHPTSQPLQNAFNTLSYLPWTGRLSGFPNSIELHQLSIYFTREWLTDDHELVMLDVLKKDLADLECADNIFIENTAFTTLLTAAYEAKREYTTRRSYEWMRTRGEELATGQKRFLATIVNQDNVHWTALIFDFETCQILHGDSFQHPICPNLCTVVSWWAHHHTGVDFTHQTLDIASQNDNFSCGMMAWDALQHYLLPHKTMLMDPLHALIDRARVFLRLTKCYHHWQEQVCTRCFISLRFLR